MEKVFLVITSIAGDTHPVLNLFANECKKNQVKFLVMGDTKSPKEFSLEGCDFYDIERQLKLPFQLVNDLPVRHYARKNLGYLQAVAQGAEIIVETDDDNLPLAGFWETRVREQEACVMNDKSWLNIYKYFTELNIWPRGFALDRIMDKMPDLGEKKPVYSPIQQGLADENPDVDAIFRLILPLPMKFNASDSVALGSNSICPFNSQNTTWFKEAFPLLYLPSYCSFRMTDIWRSFVAQRIAWTCDWPIVFHKSTVWQERNEHNLMRDFEDEISGYVNNDQLMKTLMALKLEKGPAHIGDNLIKCYEALININLIDSKEMPLIHSWIADLKSLGLNF